MGAEEERVPLTEDFQPTATTASSYCRICHEDEDLESGTKLEAPCGCSGTTKYAHRDCIQRWCDMKGNTTCEICLQKYEPNYTAPPKKENTQIIEVVTIRGNFEIPDDEEDDHSILLETDVGDDISEYVSAAERSASFCRTVAVMLTALLLARQLLVVLALDEQDYPFSLLTVFVVRACGVVAPMYMIIHSLTVIQSSIRRQQLQQRIRRLRMANRREEQQQQRQQLHVRVDIQTL